jgi:hypothetical protein
MKRVLPALVLVAIAAACGNDVVRRAAEELEVVGGEPSVQQGLPHVSRGDGGMDASFGPAAPFQVDTFDQQEVQKVDILWMVDNSRSMQAKQDRLKNNIHNFMQFLQQQSIDYHLGVVSSDTYDPAQSGKLQNNAALADPWVSTDAGVNAEADFVKNLGLGELGTSDEKGLLGGMFALTPPLASAGGANCVGSDCFLRPDAALYTVMLSDEEDSSCSPIQSNGEGCTDSDIITNDGYGTTDYWSRFYSGVKGAGAVSKVAAIVATDGTTHDCAAEFQTLCAPLVAAACGGAPADCNNPANFNTACCQQLLNQNDTTTCSGQVFFRASNFCHVQPKSPWVAPYFQITGSWNGCKSTYADGGIEFTAYYGNRYATVAQATGGVTASICDQDYTPALAQLGLQASGLRSDFPLSRAPISTSINVLVTPPGSSTPAQVLPGPGTWQYVRCTGSTPTNVVRFIDAARPQPGSRIAISYDVNVRGLGTCP